MTELALSQETKSSQWEGSVLLGAGIVPEYDGSKDHESTPYAFASLRYGSYYLETQGLGLRANVSSLSNIEFGPIVKKGSGRDNGVTNKAVASMREVDASLDAGFFVKLPIDQQILFTRDELKLEIEFLSDVGDGHGGQTFDLAMSYSFIPVESLKVGTSFQLSYGSKEYNQTYFGVDSDNAMRSGLTQYKAESGLNSISVNTQAMYQLTEQFSLAGIIQYKQLVGEAAKSPIVKRGGETSQLTFGVAIAYSF